MNAVEGTERWSASIDREVPNLLLKIGVPTRWSSFVARAHYLSWVLLIAARMSRTKEPDALGSMVSCALILASILTQRHELWPGR